MGMMDENESKINIGADSKEEAERIFNELTIKWSSTSMNSKYKRIRVRSILVLESKYRYRATMLLCNTK